MKTNYFFSMAAGLLLMAGCAQNGITIESPDANPPVSFDVYTGVQTRGPENTLPKVQNTGFGIFGYYTGQTAWASAAASATPNYMFDQKATYSSSSSTWSYTPVKYWPNKSGDKVTFFAYAPHSTTANSGIATSAKGATGNPYLDFTLQTNPLNSVDLVTADAKDKTKSTDKVGFTFKHVLSRAKFLAKASENLASGSHVFIKSVKIQGSSNNTGSKFYTKARYTFSADTWDYATSNVTIPTADYDLANILKTTAQTSMGGYTTASVDVTGTTAVSLFKDNEFFFFIPVANATGTAENNIKVEIVYDIVTVDAALNTGHSKAENTVVVALPKETLKKGSAYNYNFTVGMSKIEVTATAVDAWTVASPDSQVTVP